MTDAGLERALGMLLLDAAFCERFFLNPRSATWEAGLPLSPIEVDARWLGLPPAPVSISSWIRARCAFWPTTTASLP